MRHLFLLAVFCVSSFYIHAHPADSICTLTGHIRGLGNHRIVFSYFLDSNSYYHGDTIRAVHGRFVYKALLSEPTIINMVVLKNHPGKNHTTQSTLLYYTGRTGKRYPLIRSAMLENRSMTWNAHRNTFRRIEIANAPMNDSMKAIEKITSDIYRHDPDLVQWRKQNKFWWSKTFPAGKMIIRDSLMQEVYKRQGDSVAAYIIAHPSSYPSAYSIWRIMYSDHDVMQAAYNALDTSLRHIWTVQNYKKRMARLTGSLNRGELIPDISLADTSGHIVALSSVKGKLTLVDFWASWCGPCRKENPSVVSAYRKYHKKGLEIYSVSLDQNKASWVKAIQKDKLNWTQVSDLTGWKNHYAKAFGLTGIPGNFLIDQNGKVIAKNLRGNALKAQVKQALR